MLVEKANWDFEVLHPRSAVDNILDVLILSYIWRGAFKLRDRIVNGPQKETKVFNATTRQLETVRPEPRDPKIRE